MNTPVVINMEDELEAAFLKMQQLDLQVLPVQAKSGKIIACL